MFDRQNVPLRISKVDHEQMERDELEVSLTKLTCQVNPLTPELAGELHDFVRRTLYTASDVEVNALLGGASFSLAIPPQSVVVRMAPDQKKASFSLDECKVSGIVAKRSKKSTAWTLQFNLTFSPASEHQLAQVVSTYLKTIYVIFADAEPNLFDTRGEEARKTRKAQAEADADDEGNHPTTSQPGLH